MKIIGIKEKKTVKVIETKVCATDTPVSFRETWVNGKSQGIEAFLNATNRSNLDKELYTVFLDPKAFDKEAMLEYEGYEEFLQKWEREPKSIAEIDKYPCYLAFHSGHVLFDIYKKPVSLPYIFSYIGSLEEKRPDDPYYKRLMDLLKHHTYFLELEEEEVPYYNHDFSGQMGIKFAKVLLPQSVYERLYAACKKDKYWSVKMGDAIHMGMHQHPIDIYGVQVSKLLKQWESQKDYHNSDDDDYEGDDN